MCRHMAAFPLKFYNVILNYAVFDTFLGNPYITLQTALHLASAFILNIKIHFINYKLERI